MGTTVFNKQLPLAIGSDHAGFEYKEVIKAALIADGWKVEDKGTHSLDSTDYPDYAHPVATMVAEGNAGVGILLCGSANGVCITANKHAGIRAALCWIAEIASLARQHNNANIVCIPARYTSVEQAKHITNVFLSTAFEAGRHEKRVEKIG
ncbi:MAG: ribose 5-phosphate isomerase B [Bacteroidota bacterium]